MARQPLQEKNRPWAQALHDRVRIATSPEVRTVSNMREGNAPGAGMLITP